jgi:hypothetical protein
MSAMVTLAAIAGLTVPATAGAASAAAGVLPTVIQSGPPPTAIAGTPYRISCGTPTTCFVAGTNYNNTGAAPVTLAWNGSAWRSVVVHPPKGTSFEVMSGVSCKSATYCLIIGADLSNGASGVVRPFALSWNGKAISAVPAPPVPAGSVQTVLTGVTCLAVKHCVTAGAAVSNSSAVTWIIDAWNGSKWTMHAVKLRSSTTGVEAMDSSCVSLSYCMLAGAAFTSTGIHPLLAAWNGKTVTLLKTPVPSGFKTVLMFGVSCTSASNCAAVGNSLGTAAGPTAFAENWNGKVWTPAKLTWPKGTSVSLLEGISCTYSKMAGRHCFAMGGSGTQNTISPVVVSWNGARWTTRYLPGPGTGKATVLEGASCLSAADCVATGETGATSGNVSSPVAGFWNGAAWKVTAA